MCIYSSVHLILIVYHLIRLSKYVNPFIYQAYLWLVTVVIKNDYRLKFRDSVYTNVIVHPDNTHTHATEASNRLRADTIIDLFMAASGLKRFEYQAAPRQSKHDHWRSWLFPKDFRIKQRFQLPENHAIVMIDVDYYVDISEFLTGNVLILYTFTPEGVAGKTPNGRYYFNEDNSVTQLITGGAIYNHQLWDYNGDDFCVRHWWGSVQYVVQREKIAESRTLVMFSPVAIIYTPIPFPGKVLTRRKVVNNGVATLITDRNFIFGGLGPEAVQAVVSLEAHATVKAYMATHPKVHTSDIERQLSAHKVENAHLAALLYGVYFPSMDNCDVSMALPDPTYQSIVGLVTETGIPTMRAIVPGLIPGYAPAKSYNNDLACISGRLLMVKNSSIHPILFKHCDDFVGQIILAIGNGSPMSFEDYYDHLRTPNQKRKLLESADDPLFGTVKVSSFQKAEAYNKITDPRNISTLPTSHNHHLGRFILPLAAVMKKLDWYCPGGDPVTIARKVTELAGKSGYITSSDVSRMDGSVSAHLRSVFEQLLYKFYDKEYHAEIRNLLESESEAKGYTSFGVRYSADGTILSGSSDTSMLGTIINAFLAYCSYREYGLNPVEAFDRLGLYFGDDGLSGDLPAQLQVRITARLGMRYESEEHMRHTPVKFLSRIYLDPWTCPDSIADVKRQLGKMHLTNLPPYVPKELILRRRAEAYLINDPNTPLLSALCVAIIRILNEATTDVFDQVLSLDRPYWTGFDTAFPHPDPHSAIAYSYTAAEFERDIAWIEQVETSFNDIKDLDTLFKPLFTDVPPKVTLEVAFNDDIIKPKDGVVTHKDVVRNDSLQPAKLCFDYAKGSCTRKTCKFIHSRGPPRH